MHKTFASFRAHRRWWSRLTPVLLLTLLAGMAVAYDMTQAQSEVQLGLPLPSAYSRVTTLTGAAGLAADLAVNPSDRAASVQFYLDTYLMANPPDHGWTGSVAGCVAGTTTAAFKAAVAQRINYFRAMAGVPGTVVFEASMNAKAQAAALMMSANSALDHGPPPSWRCYTNQGAEGAGSSNLGLGTYGWDAIDLYIRDPGDSNYFVGHRRWVLHPPIQQMGTGDVPYGEGQWAAHALVVFGGVEATPTPTVREPEGFVAWPPRGYVPYTIVYPRWSFSYDGADFSAASVTMRSATGASIALVQRPIENGYGLNTLVWEPSASSSGFGGSRPSADLPFDVTVSNVRIGGQPRSFSYRVTIIDINLPPRELAFATATLSENAPAGTAAGTLSATDPEGESSITYTLVAGAGDADNGRFSIDGATLRTTGPLDFEQQTSYSVRVQASDGRAGGTSSRVLTIIVQNANDAPSGVAFQPVSLTENALAGTAAATFAAVDQDSGDVHTYTLVAGEGGADNGRFTVSGATLLTSEPLDFERSNRYNVLIEARDQTGDAVVRPFVVEITDANDPPQINGASSLFAPLDQPFTATLSASDQDTGDRLVLSVAGLPAWLSFQDHGDGTATIEGTPGSAEKGPTSFTLQVRDRAGLQTTRTVSLAVGATANYLPLVRKPVVLPFPATPTSATVTPTSATVTPTSATVTPTPATATPTTSVTPSYQFQFGRDGFWVGLCEVVRPTLSATLSEFATDPFFYFAARYPAGEEGSVLHFVVYAPNGSKVLDRAYGHRDDPACFEGIIPLNAASPAGNYRLVVDRDGRTIYQTTFTLVEG